MNIKPDDSKHLAFNVLVMLVVGLYAYAKFLSPEDLRTILLALMAYNFGYAGRSAKE